MQLLPRQTITLVCILILLLFSSSTSLGQQPILKDYKWEENPVLHQLESDEKAELEIVLKDKRVIEFFYDENKQLHEYSLKHKIVKVNSDKAIKLNNRIYIPFYNHVNILEEKARVITSEGKVRELLKEDIKEARDEETQQTYRYFAVEGVDIGSEIEYYYLVDKYPSYTGTIITLQSEEIVKNASIDIISPKNLVFATKSYNGLADMVQDTTYEEVNYLTLKEDKISKLKREESATYEPHLKKLIYKLDKDYYSGRKEMISYDEAAKAVYKSIYATTSKKAEKKLDKLIKSKGFDRISDQEEQVRKLENHIKTDFTLVDYSTEELGNLDDILDKNVCNEVGITKLFANLLKRLNVPHRIVLTSNRNSLKFDPDFEAYNFLQNYLIYFTELDLYLAPSQTFLRLGFAPPSWTHNYGLFLEPFTMGDYEIALPKINFIKAPAYTKSKDNLNVNVKFEDDFSKLKMNLKRESTGYYAQNTQPYYDFLNDEQKKEVTESIVKNISPDAEIHTINSENEGSNLFGVKPFIVTADLSSRSFIEKAGPKYIFKIGELIGPQLEMYQKEDRMLEVENDFTRKYNRVLSFNVPSEYKVKNLDKLTMNVACEVEGDTIMAFVSDYTSKGDQIEVTIVEYYKNISYPLSLFEEYRKVINAAADFNKVSLILEKN